MNIQDLHEAIGKMIEQGHGEAEVAHVNGVGKVMRVLGWELSINGKYEPQRGAHQSPPVKQLKFHTTAYF